MRSSVRWNKAEGWFELRCDSCASSGGTSAYWPLTVDEKGRPEFWATYNGLRKCRACVNTQRRRARHQTPDERRAAQRRYYRENHERRISWVHQYRDAHRDEINAKRRAAYARRVAARKGAEG